MKAHLEITSWVGTSAIGASHYYGRLRVNGHEEVQLERILTTSEARQMTKDDRRLSDGGDFYRWKAGQSTNRFFSEQEVIDAAVACLKDQHPEVTVLFRGNSGVLDPQPVLIGPDELKAELNGLVAEAEANDWWEGDEKNMNVIADRWDNKLKEAGLR